VQRRGSRKPVVVGVDSMAYLEFYWKAGNILQIDVGKLLGRMWLGWKGLDAGWMRFVVSRL
jgi:hypothetical protein